MLNIAQPVYLVQCMVCNENIWTEESNLFHCGKLTQWVKGIPGKGVNMESPMVKVKVSGYIEMKEEDLETIMKYEDPHMGLVYNIHMGFVNVDNLEFTPE